MGLGLGFTIFNKINNKHKAVRLRSRIKYNNDLVF